MISKIAKLKAKIEKALAVLPAHPVPEELKENFRAEEIIYVSPTTTSAKWLLVQTSGDDGIARAFEVRLLSKF